MKSTHATRAGRAMIAAASVMLLSACTSTSTHTEPAGKPADSQTFAFAASTMRAQVPSATTSSKSSTDAKAKQEAAKRKIEQAKSKLESEKKRLAAFEALTASLTDQQKSLMKTQRDMLEKGVATATADLRKLEAAAAPRIAGGAGAQRYHHLIAHYARLNGVPLKLAHAVVRVESAYRAHARGSAGEIGLMQLKLSTARGMGYRGSAKGLYDPETNIKYGMKYLGKAHQLAGGSTCGTILKYNAGHGARSMNPISSRYCSKVKRYI